MILGNFVQRTIVTDDIADDRLNCTALLWSRYRVLLAEVNWESWTATCQRLSWSSPRKKATTRHLGRLLEQYRGYLLMLAHRYLSERLRRRVDPADIVQLTYLGGET